MLIAAGLVLLIVFGIWGMKGGFRLSEKQAETAYTGAQPAESGQAEEISGAGTGSGGGAAGDPADARAEGGKVRHRKADPVKIVHTDGAESNPPNWNGCPETPQEFQIYSYVQVPDDIYDGDLRWSGDWGRIMAGGQEFIYFGCGVCCLSNMYSTFQQKPVTPDIVYQWCRDECGYNPDSGIGAMSWPQLKTMCEKHGLSAKLMQKPADYSEFQRTVYESAACVVLVSKQNDARLWWYTNGHYVNIWGYDYASNSVFLSDASGLFNRAKVQLTDIYNALKTASDAQYMVVFPKAG